MKTTNILLIAAFAFAAVTSGCTKNNSATGMDYTTTTASNNGNSTLTYKFKTEDGVVPQSGLTWTDGAINVNKLTLNANWAGNVDPRQGATGGQLKMGPGNVSYSSVINAPVNIFKPFMGGLMEIPAGVYTNVSVAMDLGQTVEMNNPDMPPMRLSVSLTGTYFYRGSTVPITFVVEGPTSVQMQWNKALTLTGNIAYHPEISLAINKLTANISNNMLNDVPLLDGMILIDRNTNTNLYNIMLANLPDAISVTFK